MNVRFKKSFLTLLLLGTAAYLFAQNNVPDVDSAQESSVPLTHHSLATGDFNLHYVDNGALDRPIVVFIHGTPGSLRSMRRVMADPRLHAAARLIAIDRPGWGDSQLSAGQRSVPEFEVQSAMIHPLLQQLKVQSAGQTIALVGHSYGGSLAAYMAYRYPDLVDALFMAASAIDPELARPRWYNRMASIWPFSRVLRVSLLKANDEIEGVAPALERLLPWWANARISITFLQGDKDELVDPRNFDFAQRVLPTGSSTVMQLKNQGHLLQIERSELMADLTLQLLERVTPR